MMADYVSMWYNDDKRLIVINRLFFALSQNRQRKGGVTDL